MTWLRDFFRMNRKALSRFRNFLSRDRVRSYEFTFFLVVFFSCFLVPLFSIYLNVSYISQNSCMKLKLSILKHVPGLLVGFFTRIPDFSGFQNFFTTWKVLIFWFIFLKYVCFPVFLLIFTAMTSNRTYLHWSKKIESRPR